ncbi:hypothetical protein [Butyrivibrio sp. M55]|uniref:hypothetical protein n=1 Tax=Butyrivibrio sp. M55 TaxID=1855323 RepID=UPI0008E7691A|nr:hypothetical protein [Butyrivibrio sp. M55]SFU67630.1 hypothetical protein SAMN05216540_105258 [Butyrivibrio sp. M55]
MKFVVKCNGKAISHAVLLIFCTAFMVYASIYAVLSGAIKGGSLWSVLIVLLGFIIYLISMTLLTTKLIYNRIIVDDNKLIIREAFHKTDKILIDDIKKYYKKSESIRARSFMRITIIYGNNKSYEVEDDVVINFDRFLNYLNSNCPERYEFRH